MSSDYGWSDQPVIDDADMVALYGLDTATESLGLSSSACDAPCVPTSFVLERGGVFHITLSAWDTNSVASFRNVSMSVTTWLHTLPEDVTVHVFYGDQASELSTDLPFLACFLMILIALRNTKANTVFVLDRPVGDVGAYMALACKTLAVTPMGMLSIQPVTRLASVAPDSFDQAIKPYVRYLLDNAMARSILTEDEVARSVQNETLNLRPRDLLMRAKMKDSDGFRNFALAK